MVCLEIALKHLQKKKEKVIKLAKTNISKEIKNFWHQDIVNQKSDERNFPRTYLLRYWRCVEQEKKSLWSWCFNFMLYLFSFVNLNIFSAFTFRSTEKLNIYDSISLIIVCNSIECNEHGNCSDVRINIKINSGWQTRGMCVRKHLWRRTKPSQKKSVWVKEVCFRSKFLPRDMWRIDIFVSWTKVDWIQCIIFVSCNKNSKHSTQSYGVSNRSH